ncbi:unnamed protein product [Rotaria socialis]
MFDIDGMYNSQNDRIWAINRQEADKAGGRKQKRKFSDKIMVWLGVCSNGVFPVGNYVLPVTLKYGNEMFGNDWIFQQNNATPHTDILAQQWCQEHFPTFIDKDHWPPNSPDLNPLDYCIWDDKFRDGSWRLCDIITGDETWIYHRQIHHKSTNKTWIGDGESPRTIVRRRKFERKNLFSIFFKSNAPVLIHAVDNDETIDHDYYIENCLKPVVKEIRKQRKSNGTKGIKLLRDNASPHRHSDVINYLTQEGINIIPHPPYSPDLAPCDYWLNDYIKQNLTDQPDEKSLAHAVSKLIKNIPEEEFKKTFDKLLERMELCINNHGDYFEHLIK